MPSCMIHLSAAVRYSPVMPVRLMLGSVAPDAIQRDWKTKDSSHFRNVEGREARLCALRAYADSLDMTDVFYQGVLLHLYLDCLWDDTALREFKNLHENDPAKWFRPYRDEISAASEWLYHHTAWSRMLWRRMLAYNISLCPPVRYVSNEDLCDYLRRNFQWHEENARGPSAVFSPEYIESFIVSSVHGFTHWLGKEKGQDMPEGLR